MKHNSSTVNTLAQIFCIKLVSSCRDHVCTVSTAGMCFRCLKPNYWRITLQSIWVYNHNFAFTVSAVGISYLWVIRKKQQLLQLVFFSAHTVFHLHNHISDTNGTYCWWFISSNKKPFFLLLSVSKFQMIIKCIITIPCGNDIVMEISWQLKHLMPQKILVQC